MIQKMTGPSQLSANALADQVGIAQTTLSRWLRDAARPPQAHETHSSPQKGKIMMVKRPADWTPVGRSRSSRIYFAIEIDPD
jgi:hypothetical protein